jgi:hypothetical protein
MKAPPGGKIWSRTFGQILAPFYHQESFCAFSPISGPIACKDSYLDTYHMGAREYDPSLGRWLSADSIVPGNASGASGGLGTIGYSDQVRLTPLTVGFHEPQFLQVLNAENRELLQFGQPAQWGKKTRREHNAPMGPANPQALNRYAYVLNNPLRYVDPTGHFYAEGDLSPEEAQRLIEFLDRLGDLDLVISLLGEAYAIGSAAGIINLGTLSTAELAAAYGVSVATMTTVVAVGDILLATAGICGLLTWHDLGNIHEALLEVDAGKYGAHIKLDTTTWGLDRVTITTSAGQRSVILKGANGSGSAGFGGSGAAGVISWWLNPSAVSIQGGYGLCVFDAAYWRWGYGDSLLGLE